MTIDGRVHAALVRVAQLGPEHAGALAAPGAAPPRAAAASAPASASCASPTRGPATIALPAPGRGPGACCAEMKCSAANFRNGRRVLDLALQLLALVARRPRPTCSPRAPPRGRFRGCSRRCARPGRSTPWVASSSSRTTLARLDRLQRLDHRELLDRLEHLALAAQAGGVDQLEALAVALERHARSRRAWCRAGRRRSGAPRRARC